MPHLAGVFPETIHRVIALKTTRPSASSISSTIELLKLCGPELMLCNPENQFWMRKCSFVSICRSRHGYLNTFREFNNASHCLLPSASATKTFFKQFRYFSGARVWERTKRPRLLGLKSGHPKARFVMRTVQRTWLFLEEWSRVTTKMRSAEKTSSAEITQNLPGAIATRRLFSAVWHNY